MAKQTYKALKNVSIAGDIHEKGSTFVADSKSAHVRTALHFEQITEIADKDPAAKKQQENTGKTEPKAADKDPDAK